MFYYFLPLVAVDAVTREYLQASTLAPLFWDLLRSPALFDARIRCFPVHAKGPNGSSGCLVAVMPAILEGPPPGVRPGQTWVHVKAGNYWLGYEGDLPGPEALQREHVVAGEEHELGDGRIWVCPIVRRQGCINELPSRWGIDPGTGDYQATMLPRYAAAWEAAGRILDAQIKATLTRADALDLCVQMLAINYRIGVAEVSLLGLLDDTTWDCVWRAATDAAFLESWIASQGSDGTSKKNV